MGDKMMAQYHRLTTTLLTVSLIVTAGSIGGAAERVVLGEYFTIED